MGEVAEQFNYWNSQPETSVQHLNTVLAAEPLDLEALEDALAGLEIEHEKFQQLISNLTNNPIISIRLLLNFFFEKLLYLLKKN